MGHDAELLAAAGVGDGEMYPRAGMWGEWLFKGNADDTYGTNDGTVATPTLVNDRFGAANSAYAFVATSNDRITMSNVADPVNVSNLSWINPNGITPPTDDRLLSWRQDAANYLILRLVSGKIQVLWAEGVTFESCITDAAHVTGGSFQSVGFTLENANAPTIFYNGQPVASTGSGTSARNLASSVFTFGGDASGKDFNGIIDDIPIWSVVKSDAEMLAIHNRSKP